MSEAAAIAMPVRRLRNIQLALACSAYALAVAIFSVSPILVGVLMSQQSLDESQAGLVVTFDMLATAVTGFLLGPRLAAVSQRTMLVIGSVVLASGNLLSLASDQYGVLLAARTLSGLGAGALFICANTLLAATADAVRAYGIATIAATFLGSVLLFGLPVAVAHFGKSGCYYALAALAAGFAVYSLLVPMGHLGKRESEGVTSVMATNKLPLIGLGIGIALITLVQDAYFGFAERIGVSAGASSETVGAVIGIGYVGGVLTSALATWISTRWGSWRPIVLGFGLQAGCIILACSSKQSAVVLASLMGQTLALCFGIPYLLGLTAAVDASGRFANIGVGLFYFSLAAGPFVGGVVIESFGFGGIATLVGAGTAVGLLAVIPAAQLQNRPASLSA